jgi:hypothetical protein
MIVFLHSPQKTAQLHPGYRDHGETDRPGNATAHYKPLKFVPPYLSCPSNFASISIALSCSIKARCVVPALEYRV